MSRRSLCPCSQAYLASLNPWRVPLQTNDGVSIKVDTLFPFCLSYQYSNLTIDRAVTRAEANGSIIFGELPLESGKSSYG